MTKGLISTTSGGFSFIFKGAFKGFGLSDVWFGDRGVFAGGWTGPTADMSISNMDYITISITNNINFFGNLSKNKISLAGCSNSTRGIFGGGRSSYASNTSLYDIDYINIASLSNSSVYGTLTYSIIHSISCSNHDVGLFIGGIYDNIIEYHHIQKIDFNILSNNSLFGSLSQTRSAGAGCSNHTRGVLIAGNRNQTNTSNIEYVTFSIMNDIHNFGNASRNIFGGGACSNETYGVFSNVILDSNISETEYINVSTISNSIIFGQLTYRRGLVRAVNNQTRGVFGCGESDRMTYTIDALDYLTIDTLSTAVSFGDTIQYVIDYAACSGN